MKSPFVLRQARMGTALAALAMSQDRHWQHLGGGRHCPPRTSTALRCVGWALLLVAMVLALMRDGAAFGSFLWATVITIGALSVVATLSWRSRWLRPMARLLQHLG